MSISCLSLFVLAVSLAGSGRAFPTWGNSDFGNFAPMQPLSFPTFNMQAQRQLQNQNTQGQTQGQSAATGSGSALEGQLSSQQTSNTNTDTKGTVSQGGSLGQCQGTACKLDGASQVGNQGAFQSQGSSFGQNQFGSQGQGGSPSFPTFGQQFGSQNKALQNQFQSQFQTGGASIGSGSIDKGTVNSVQNTQAKTGKDGSIVESTNLGQAAGTNAALSGAVQATGQGQSSDQTNGLTSTDQNQNLAGSVGDGTAAVGALSKNGAMAGQQKQKQLQTQGTGAAVGESNAAEGTAQNMLSSVVDTNAGGTRVSSNAANTATGKGLKVSGSVSSSGQGQSQKNNQMALNLLNMNGMMGLPRQTDAAPQPVPVAGQY